MTVKYVDGWYEIEHLPPVIITHSPNDNWSWMDRSNWCQQTFTHGEWEMRNPINHYSIGPSGPGKRVLSTTPLTWRFKREADALLFTLRWQT